MKRLQYQELVGESARARLEEAPESVIRIVRDVRVRGDEAVREYSHLLDGCDMPDFRVSPGDVTRAAQGLDDDLRRALQLSISNLRRFARAQLDGCRGFDLEIEPGVSAGQRVVPIRRVGVYVPGGRYPLVSSLLMGAIPAREAGVDQVVVCSPPHRDGTLSPALLAAAEMAGVDEVYAIGGAQAIAALAYGTETLPAVDKIVGPGNRFVTAAKRMVYGQVGIDFLAGPTEILIIADHSADPALVAVDLIAQAEHDADARGILVTPDSALLDHVEREVTARLKSEPASGPLRVSLEKRGLGVVVGTSLQAVTLANLLAPEHLQLMVEDPSAYSGGLRNYGSLFIGPWSAEVLGDYSSGLNHVLPTGGASRYTGGLGVRDFLKFQTVLTTSREGFSKIGPAAASIARAEGLVHHAMAVTLREAADRDGGSPPEVS